MAVGQRRRSSLGNVSELLRWTVPVRPRAEGGTEERPRRPIGRPDRAALEPPWRPVLLLLPLADGASGGRDAAVHQEEGTRPEVQPGPLEQDGWTRVETHAGYLDDALSGQGGVEGRAAAWTARTDRR